MLDKRSLTLLQGVHPQLASVTMRACKAFTEFSEMDVRVTSGYRTAEEQKKLFQAGKSKTTNSKHMLGLAVDLAVIKHLAIPNWEGKRSEYVTAPHWYKMINQFMQREADEFNVIIGWGGHWKMRDYSHWWIADDDASAYGVRLLSSPSSIGQGKGGLGGTDVPHQRGEAEG